MKPAFLLLISALALPAQEAEKNAVVEGVVVNGVTGVGIEGAKVELSNRNHKHNYNLVTDAKGVFFYDNVAPGDYLPVVRKDGFILSKSGITGGGTPFHVEARDEPVRLQFELIPPGRLRGRVLAPDGNPAGGVEVALGPSYRATQKTAADGSFAFESVEAGPHSLVAGDERSRTYFPAASDPALAEQIKMAPGADQGVYEIRLQTTAVHRIRGAVLDAAGSPAAKALVELIAPLARVEALGLSANGVTDFSLRNRPTGVTPIQQKSVTAGEDGVFEFPVAPEGDWSLLVSAGRFRESMPISVRKDLDDVRIRLDAPSDLAGRVTTSDGHAPPVPAVLAQLMAPAGMGVMSISGKDGLIQFRNVAPGLYRIRASAFGNYYVNSVDVGETDATDQPVSLGPASGAIRIVIKPGATISGRTEKGEGSTVLVIPRSLAEGSIGSLSIAGDDGKFQFAGLAPGDYYVIAVNGFDGPSMLNIERLSEIVRDAETVHLDEGAAASLQVKAPVELKSVY